MQTYIKKSLFIISLFFLFSYQNTYASVLNFHPQSISIDKNEEFQIDLTIDTEKKDINAIQGTIIFPESMLYLKQIKDGNSILNFWVDKPKIDGKNKIIFSGIIPGGYTEKQGLALSLIFESYKEGIGEIKIDNAKVLLNDGKGTLDSLSFSSFPINVSKNLNPYPKPIIIKDIEKPESFNPIISKDPSLFQNKYFVSFETQDKGSGIKEYQISERREHAKIINSLIKENWKKAESPYLLNDQQLKSYVTIKAIDNMGNERLITISPKNSLKWYDSDFIWIGIILICIFIYSFKKIRYEKRS